MEKLLPYSYKKFSVPFLFFGAFCVSAYLNDIKLDVLNIKVFALASTYMENRFIQIVRTNAMDELGVSFLIIGFFLLLFSKEKNENEKTNHLRLRAFVVAIKVVLMLYFLGYWLFFGYIIFPISVSLFLIFLISYYLYFRYLLK
jgi:hypothetical protein